jgi:hypothetical protein
MPRALFKCYFAVLSGLLLIGANCPAAEKMNKAHLAFFENKIRPILVKHCYKCHSAKAKKIGGKLYLDSSAAIAKGGESGKIIVAGNPDKSLLIQSLKYHGTEMPPDEPLPENIVNDFIKWVSWGAPDPRTESAPPVVAKSVASDHWSLQPVGQSTPPQVRSRSWGFDSLDQFVLAKMESKGLHPTRDASSRMLVRRLYYDLVGLPPNCGEVESFVAAYQQEGQGAVSKLVDSLLASPQFGERWGRHWLDVARYGESNGNDGLSRNATFPHAWRYRDYVIAALNADVPFDRFITEQIAGDLLPADSPRERDRLLVATGYLALGSKPAKAMNNNFEMDVVADQIDTVSTGIMGLSVACARCHDHKFDPVPTADYYAMAGIFKSSQTMWGLAANQTLTAPDTPLHVLQAAPKVVPSAAEAKAIAIAIEVSRGHRDLKKPKHAYPAGTPLAMGIGERKKMEDCKININGDAKKLGSVVKRGFLSALRISDVPSVATNQSGRLQLARWLTAKDHPLTSRVAVNRIWLQLFGEGLVRTPDEFGIYGDKPTHPELLDHLASRFVSGGWSTKQMIREIVLSRTYQLSSEADAKLVAADAANRFLARHNRRRLDAESLRDSILAASGELAEQPADGSAIRFYDVLINTQGNMHKPSNHRSIYLCMMRNSPPPELAAFDLPDALRVEGKRSDTILPTHALYLLNNPFVVEKAEALAGDLVADTRLNDRERVAETYRHILTRQPVKTELERAIELVQGVEADLSSTASENENRQVKVWASLAQALFMTSEFRYVD